MKLPKPKKRPPKPRKRIARKPLKKKTPKRSTLRNKADALFRRIIHARNRCEAAGEMGLRCFGNLQVAHIYSRRYYRTRWDERNALAMCACHHTTFHRLLAHWDDYLARHVGPRQLAAIRREAMGPPTKVDYAELIARLERKETP